jgi:hypothetical protein
VSEELNLLSDPTIIGEIRNNTEKGQKAKAVLQKYFEAIAKEEPAHTNDKEVKEFYKQICLQAANELFAYDDEQIDVFKKKALHIAEMLLNI